MDTGGARRLRRAGPHARGLGSASAARVGGVPHAAGTGGRRAAARRIGAAPVSEADQQCVRLAEGDARDAVALPAEGDDEAAAPVHPTGAVAVDESAPGRDAVARRGIVATARVDAEPGTDPTGC